MKEEPKVLTVERAGEILQISRASAYQAVALGEIPSIRIGRRLLVPRAKLMAMLGEREPGVPAGAGSSAR